MDKQLFVNEKLNERYYLCRHESGLQVLICPKEGYQTSFALFGTRYGSIDTKFKKEGEESYATVPEGIAHFLEHKLFESESGDVFARYAETGASANAYTSFDRTCYLFSCTDNFDESFKILLDFVQSPYFTKESVEKEQGIIGQEIEMYEDSPVQRVLFNALEAMYQNHSVRIDIVGTRQSIAQIDADTLYRLYDTFYNPNNMFICVAGDVDADHIIDMVEDGLKRLTPVHLDRGDYEEPEDVSKKRTEQPLEVSMPLFCYGYKQKVDRPCRTLQEKIHMDILLDIVAGNSSPLYKELFDGGYINQNFSAEYFYGRGYAAVIFFGESNDPDYVVKRINAEAGRLKAGGIEEAGFERSRRKLYGRRVMMCNSVDSVVTLLTESAFTGDGMFDDISIYESVELSDMAPLLEVLDEAKASLSVIVPKGRN